MTADVHELAARQRKAVALADVLDAADAPANHVTEEQWGLAERIAGVRRASQATRRLVLEMLTERRRLRTLEAFGDMG